MMTGVPSEASTATEVRSRRRVSGRTRSRSRSVSKSIDAGQHQEQHKQPQLLAWNYDFDPHGNIIDMHLHRLRQKIDHGFAHPLIHTVLGAGYRIRQPNGEESATGQ